MEPTLKNVIAAIEAEMFNEVLTKDNYNEIKKLKQMLSASDIPHDYFQMFDGYKIAYPSSENQVCSVIQHKFSYGGKVGLIEIMGLTDGNAVEGNLSAEEVFNRISAHYMGCDTKP